MCQFALTVKLLLIVAKLHGLSSKSIDFVLAFPQMEVDAEIYMDPPIGRELEFGHEICMVSRARILQLDQKLRWLDRKGLCSFYDAPCLNLLKSTIVLTYVYR